MTKSQKKRLIFGGFKQKSSVKNRLISFGDSYLEEKESIKSPTTLLKSKSSIEGTTLALPKIAVPSNNMVNDSRSPPSSSNRDQSGTSSNIHTLK